MRLLAAIIAMSIAMSGCASIWAGPSTANEHLDDFQQEAARQLDQPYFAGMAGFEGDIDLDLIHNFSREELEEDGQNPDITNKFDVAHPNGELGDGRVGTWFAAYFETERDEVLILQATPNGMNSHHFDFTQEAHEESDVEPRLTPLDVLNAFTPKRTGSAECEEHTSIPAGIDSDRAARVAADQPEFRNHTQTHEGDYIYVYVPSWVDCWTDEPETSPAIWMVAYTDIDEWIDGDDQESPVAYVMMYAANGTIMEQGIEHPIDLVSLHFPLHVQGGVLPAVLDEPAHGSHPIEVPEGADSMDLYVHYMGNTFDTWLISPSGHRIDVTPWGTAPMAAVYLRDLEAGAWELHGSFEHIQPRESRYAAVDAYIWVPQDNAES